MKMKSDSKDLAIISKVEDFIPNGLGKPKVLSSYQPNLWGVGLEVLNFPKGEVPKEVILTNYTIAINLGQSHHLEQTTDGDYEEALLFSGCVGILPFHLPMRSCWHSDIKHLYLHLEPQLLSRHSQELFDDDEVEIIYSVLPLKDLLIKEICLAINNELTGNRNGSRIYVESMADALAVHLLRNYSTRKKPIKTYLGGLSPYKLKRVKEFINDNLHNQLSVDELAKEAQLSRYHFSRAFKQSMGITPHQYIIQQRVERAKQLLLQGKMTIIDISIACGFTHQSHLNHHFKRLTGSTPKKFLK